MNAQQIHEKTFKREIAYLLLIFWVVITYRIVFLVPPAHVEAYAPIYSIITTMTFVYLGAAMGMKVFQNYAAAKVGG